MPSLFFLLVDAQLMDTHLLALNQVGVGCPALQMRKTQAVSTL